MKFLGCIINESAKLYFLTIAKKSWPFKLRMTVILSDVNSPIKLQLFQKYQHAWGSLGKVAGSRNALLGKTRWSNSRTLHGPWRECSRVVAPGPVQSSPRPCNGQKQCQESWSIKLMVISSVYRKFTFLKSLGLLLSRVSLLYNFSIELGCSCYHIVAAFQGMHVSPAKNSYACLPRKCDYRTEGQMDRQTPDRVIPMCRYASQATQKILLRLYKWIGDTQTDNDTDRHCKSLPKIANWQKTQTLIFATVMHLPVTRDSLLLHYS